jgi:hypothetical protein
MKESNEEANRPTFPMFISELTEEERKSVKERIKRVPLMFRECENCLREYEANEATALKLLVTMYSMFQGLREFGSDLAEKHKKPKSEGAQQCKYLLDAVTVLQQHSMKTQDMIFRDKAKDAFLLAQQIYYDSLEHS